MNLTFKQLRLVRALAETGSVSRAADRMHITQPTASDQLKDVASAVGFPIYHLVSRRVQMTELGLELAAAAGDIIDRLEEFEQVRDQVAGLSRGRLKIAAVSTAKYFIPRWVGAFCEEFPGIEVSLQILNRDGVLARLKQHADDLYVMSMPPSGMALSDHVFMKNDLVLIAPNTGSTKDLPASLSELAKQRFILREMGSGTRMAVEQAFAALNIRPDIRMELGSNEAVKEAVAAGLGLGVVSQHALPPNPADGGLVQLEISGFPIQSAWHVVYPKSRRLSPVAKRFHQQLLARAVGV